MEKDFETVLEAELKGKVEKGQVLTENEQALYERINKGRLTTLEIMGRIFYVDFRMFMLRPHNDFKKNAGIQFADLGEYLSEDKTQCLIPYDPQKRTLADVNDLGQIPENCAWVSFPAPHIMDPVGYARISGNLKDILTTVPQKSCFDAKLVSEADENLNEINFNAVLTKGLKRLSSAENNTQERSRKKGKKMGR
ncbi:hypothetical protein [Fluviicola sp.]|uniref:hypothetical protein n=1 Tax=Fluviicola sp. TaxID=1917219 RepID=UPI0031E1E652